MRRPVKIAFFATALVLLVAGAAMAQSYTYAVNLARGETAYVTCSGAQRLSVDRQGLIAILACGRPDQVQPTATPLPPVPTATATPAPPPPDPGALLPVEPLSMLGSCTAEIHDRYTVVGPDGNRWRTWHPQRDPSGCTFAHEHGDDPRTSNADNSLPAFGYIGSLVGRVEAHEGFKVYVANRGDVNDENRTAQTDSRVVVHMTTGRPLPGMTGGRFTMPFHSLEYDMVAPDGHEVHVAGMANTFSAGSICDRDRLSQTANPIGRVLYIDPAENACAANSTYEIWGLKLDLSNNGQSGATIHVAAAAFDTQTGITPSTGAAFATGLLGCDREAYHGPVYWYNRSGPLTFRTDAYGNRQADGPLEQYVSQHNDIGIPMSNDQTQFKKRPPSYCAPGLAVPN